MMNFFKYKGRHNNVNVNESKKRPPDKKILSTGDLFGSEREIIIEHGSLYYRLYITKAGKLILNK